MKLLTASLLLRSRAGGVAFGVTSLFSSVELRFKKERKLKPEEPSLAVKIEAGDDEELGIIGEPGTCAF